MQQPKKKILIVEDESIIALDVEDKLLELGLYQCEIADNVKSALELTETFQPDIILLDINLNDEIDGIELAGKIQKLKNIPIIFVTAYSDDTTLNRAKLANPLGYINKPFTVNELSTSLNLAFYKHEMDLKLLKSEHRYRSLFDTAQVGIITISSDTEIIEDCNDCFMEILQITDKQDIIGKPFTKFFKVNSDYELVKAALQKNGFINHYETTLTLPNEETLWLEGSTWINQQEDLIESVFIDITERKSMEDRLRQSQKMETVGQITAGIAHEINNPLAVISTRLQLLKDDLENTEITSASKQIDIINKNIYRMSNIIERLLGFSRTNEMRISIDINTILDDVLFFVTNKAKKLKIKISLDYCQEPPKLFVFKNRIEQVFLNIIMNSFDAMPQGGTLQITTKKTGSVFKIIFADDGCGMNEDTLKKIFDPFYTTKPVGKGTGLGMYISYGIVKEHNGDIALTSSPDKGTKVVVSLPQKQE